jgi:hypothetical protein
MATQSEDIDLGNTYLYQQLDEYPWDEDREFQGGLRAILGSVQDLAQIEHLTLRAKCYYFARKAGTPVDFDGYKQWVETQRRTAPPNGISASPTVPDAVQASASGDSSANTGGGLNDAPKPASFAEICEMIAEGKPIPGIKEIPNTILEGQASDKVAQSRKKPWEKNQTESEAQPNPSWMS